MMPNKEISFQIAYADQISMVALAHATPTFPYYFNYLNSQTVVDMPARVVQINMDKMALDRNDHLAKLAQNPKIDIDSLIAGETDDVRLNQLRGMTRTLLGVKDASISEAISNSETQLRVLENIILVALCIQLLEKEAEVGNGDLLKQLITRLPEMSLQAVPMNVYNIFQ